MEFVKKNSYIICFIIFLVAAIVSVSEMIIFFTDEYLSVSGIIMNILNLVLFGGIIIGCLYKNVRIIKSLIVTLIAWDGIVYLVNILPDSFGIFSEIGGVWQFMVGQIATIIAMILVVFAAAMYLFGNLLNENFNKIVSYLYIISAFVMLVGVIALIIYVFTAPATLFWRFMLIEAALKLCIFAGCSIGVYIFNRDEKSIE